jgi:large subunit ribosomal protein L10
MPSKKVLEAKRLQVDQLAAEISQAQSVVFAEYRGLTVAQDTEIRAALRKAGVVYKVVKNTLSSRALAQNGLQGIEEALKGPTAVAFSKSDVVAPAKVLKEYAGKYDKLKIKGGILDGKVIGLDDVVRLAAIPSREVLYGQLVFTLLAPITSLAVVLNAIREKLEAAAAPEVPAEAAAAPEVPVEIQS